MEFLSGAAESDWVLVAQAIVTFYMTGLIWFVQVVHYPLMNCVDREIFAIYHRAHSRRTSWAVGPPMLVEGVTALATTVHPSTDVPQWQAWLGLALVALIWISTAAIQVPLHRQLAGGFGTAAHRRLVATNWIRVASWSARTVLVMNWLLSVHGRA